MAPPKNWIDEVENLDKNIGQALRKAIQKKDPAKPIDPATSIDEDIVRAVMAELLKDDSFSDSESQAMWAFIDRATTGQGTFKVNFEPTAWNLLHLELAKAIYRNEAPLKRNRVRPGSELITKISNHLGAFGSITFVSPGTHVQYRSPYYLEIRNRLRAGDISVYDLRNFVQPNPVLLPREEAGSYRSDSNSLVIHNDNESEFGLLVIHECTHAIQDWLDLDKRGGLVRTIEADAYISGAAYAIGVLKRPETYFNYPTYKAALPAAKLVLKGKADLTKDNEKNWVIAYHAVLNAVDVDTLYSAQKYDQAFLNKPDKVPDRMKEAFERLEKTAPIAPPKPGKPVYPPGTRTSAGR